MGLSREELKHYLEQVCLPDLDLGQLPVEELYMDQLTSFMESKLRGMKRSDEEKVLTRTMINNYSKMGVLMASQNKKYGKEHMILLVLIYCLKHTLSIGDIKTLFDPILNNIASREDDVISLEDIYHLFLELNQIEFDQFYGSFAERLDQIQAKVGSVDEEHRELAEMFLFVLLLVAQSSLQKRLAERIIDSYFASLT